jgi:hypothetical protein
MRAVLEKLHIFITRENVSVLGAVKKTGSKKTGIHVEVEKEASSHNTILEHELQRIEEAIRKKTKKLYPPNTALLVVFDDYVSIQSEADLKGLRNRVRSLLSSLQNFRWVAVIGWSKRTFEEFDLALVES